MGNGENRVATPIITSKRDMISSEQQEKFRAEYNPDGSVLRREQLRMLDILLHIDKVCKEHNIHYWLSSGTLLGAVRHGGFIPWDDDLDIEMMREDFLRFKKVWRDSEDFVLQTPENDLYYINPFLKVRDTHSIIKEHNIRQDYVHNGIFVDIFAMEPTHKFVNHQTHLQFNRIRKYIAKHERSKFVDKVVAFRKILAFQAIKVWRVVSFPFPGKQLRHTLGTWCYRKPRFKKEIFPLTIVKFEGYDFPAPHNSDAYLRHLYGDYMAIPEEKQIHTVHVEFL